MVTPTIMKGNWLNLEDLGQELEGQNPTANTKSFSRDLRLIHALLKIHDRHAILIQWYVSQCDNGPVLKYYLSNQKQVYNI